MKEVGFKTGEKEREGCTESHAESQVYQTCIIVPAL